MAARFAILCFDFGLCGIGFYLTILNMIQHKQADNVCAKEELTNKCYQGKFFTDFDVFHQCKLLFLSTFLADRVLAVPSRSRQPKRVLATRVDCLSVCLKFLFRICVRAFFGRGTGERFFLKKGSPVIHSQTIPRANYQYQTYPPCEPRGRRGNGHRRYVRAPSS